MESKTRADYAKGRRRTERTRLNHIHESKVNEVRRPTEKKKNNQKTPPKPDKHKKTHQQQNLKELESWELEPDRAAGQ